MSRSAWLLSNKNKGVADVFCYQYKMNVRMGSVDMGQIGVVICSYNGCEDTIGCISEYSDSWKPRIR